MVTIELIGGPFDGQVIPMNELPKHYCLCHTYGGASKGIHWPMIRRKVIKMKDIYFVGKGLLFEDDYEFDAFIEECDTIGIIRVIFFEGKGKTTWLT